jgi:hypothetical protein
MNKDATISAGSPQMIALGNRLYATWQEAGQIRAAVGK